MYIDLFNFSYLLVTSLPSSLDLNHSATPWKGWRTEEWEPGADLKSSSAEQASAQFKSRRTVSRGGRTSQQDVCGWSSWHEVLAFMFIFGCIFLSPLMQISGLGSNPTVQTPKLPKSQYRPLTWEKAGHLAFRLWLILSWGWGRPCIVTGRPGAAYLRVGHRIQQLFLEFNIYAFIWNISLPWKATINAKVRQPEFFCMLNKVLKPTQRASEIFMF